ncbi:unnamed protein product, partial [Leptidea sinapis]
MDELSLVQICDSNFTDEEVESGKNNLFNALAGEGLKLIQRKGEDKRKKNIRDVLKVASMSAKDLNRLPPVSFDHVDVTRLLKDILILKTELQHPRNDSISKLEMENLKTSIVSEVCSRMGPSSDTRNVPVPSRKKVENAGAKLLNTDMTRAILTSLDTVVSPPSYRDIANRTSMQRINVDSMRTGRKVGNEHDDDGFTVQLRNSNKCGTATDPSKLKVAQLPEAIYLSRLESTCTVEDVKEHIESKGAQAIDALMLPQRKELDF